jgi:S1-C subfamily serine protease
MALVSCASTQNDCNSCSHDSKSLSIVPPTDSFVKILAYNKGTLISTASGVIVSHVNDTNTIVATAKHVCLSEFSTKDKFKLLDHNLKEYKALVLNTTPDHDLCLITTLLPIDAPAVKLADSGPLAGNSVYNLAAPYGIHDKDMILIFHGHYSGKMSIPVEEYPLDIYTIPGGPGSSGSPIFNEKWELIGIVSRGHVRIEHVMLSVGFEHIKQAYITIEPELPKLASLRVFEDLMESIEAAQREREKEPDKAPQSVPGALQPQ